MVEKTIFDKSVKGKPDLALKAEQAFSVFKGDVFKEHLCKRIFKALMCRSEDGFIRSRDLSVEDLCLICEADTERIISIINTFREWETGIFIPPSNAVINEKSLISITDERLVSSWVRLSGWADEEQESITIYHDLVAEAEFFQHGENGYLSEPKLTEYLKWYNINLPNAYWASQFDSLFDKTIDFLFRSMEMANLVAGENENNEGRVLSRGILISRIVGLVAVAALAFGAYWFWPSPLIEKIAQIPDKTEVFAEKLEMAPENNVEAGFDSFISNLARQKAQEYTEKSRNPGDAIDLPVETTSVNNADVPGPKTEVGSFTKENQESTNEGVKTEATRVMSEPAEKTNESRAELPGEITLNLRSSVRDFAFHPYRSELIAGCDNGMIQKIRVVSGKLKKSSRTILKNEKIRSLDYSKDGKFIAVGTEKGQVIIFVNSNGKLTEMTRLSFDRVIQQVGFLNASGGYYLAVGGVSQVSIAKLDGPGITITDQVNHGHIGAMNIGKSGKHVLVADLNNCYIYQVSGTDGTLRSPSVVKTEVNISSLALNRRGNLLASGLVNGELVLSKLNSSNQVLESKTFSVHRSLISSLDFHQNGSSVQLVSSGFDRILTLVDVPGKMAGNHYDHRTFKGHDKWVYKGKFGSDGKYMISSSEDGKVFIWDTRDDGMGEGTLGYKR